MTNVELYTRMKGKYGEDSYMTRLRSKIKPSSKHTKTIIIIIIVFLADLCNKVIKLLFLEI